MSTSRPALPDAQWRSAFRLRLRAWYRKHARRLPWRQGKDPYAIWLSEIMLQQTQVATVIPYFERFLLSFPTIEALARANEQQVLRLWEGLGYYRRARHLHQAAQVIVRQHGGQFPRDPDILRRLPGIGRYTAGAILSIAFDQPLPILEANTRRLLCRLLGYRDQPDSPDGQRLLWAMAEAVLPRRGAGTINQALMELGSEICRNRAPQCEICPVATLCRAKIQGLQELIPPPKRKPRIEEVCEAAVLVWRRGRVLLIKHADNQRWAGLWGFPRFAIQSENQAALRDELIENVRRLTGITITPGNLVKTIRHGVTRFRITLQCYEAVCMHSPSRSKSGNPMKWLRPAELHGYPLSTSGRELATWLISDTARNNASVMIGSRIANEPGRPTEGR